MDTIEFKSFQKVVTPRLSQYEKVNKILKEKRIKYLDYLEASIRAKNKRVSVKVKRKAKKRAKLPKQPKIKTLEARLKKVMYPYIKQRDGNTCISCGKQGLVGGQYGNWNAGHFIKAELCNMIYRYDEQNINSQCVGCNKWKAGNTIAYRFAMIAKYGLEIVEELEENYDKPLPMNFNHREWLLEQIAKYDNKKS